jgi:hypothetical protein
MTAPSLRFTIVDQFGKRTESICGLSTRSENSATPRVHIHNHDLGYHFELEPATGLYTAFRVNEYGGPAWLKPLRTDPTKRSGRTMHFHTETVDTGERREIFGYNARRVITKNRQTRVAELMSEAESDGWYIDPPTAWLTLHPPPKPGFFTVLASGNERDDYEFTDVGKRETGFVLLASRIRKTHFRDELGNLRVQESVEREEVAEFSEAPLEPGVFVPPPDFRRVPRLPDGIRYALRYRMRLQWETLKDSRHLSKLLAKFEA